MFHLALQFRDAPLRPLQFIVNIQPDEIFSEVPGDSDNPRQVFGMSVLEAFAP